MHADCSVVVSGPSVKDSSLHEHQDVAWHCPIWPQSEVRVPHACATHLHYVQRASDGGRVGPVGFHAGETADASQKKLRMHNTTAAGCEPKILVIRHGACRGTHNPEHPRDDVAPDLVPLEDVALSLRSAQAVFSREQHMCACSTGKGRVSGAYNTGCRAPANWGGARMGPTAPQTDDRLVVESHY